MTAKCVQQYKVGVLQNILREGGLKWAREIWGFRTRCKNALRNVVRQRQDEHGLNVYKKS